MPGLPPSPGPEAVRRFSCFRTLSPEQEGEVARALRMVRLGAGEQLFRQGEPGDTLYLVVSGQIEISVEVPDLPDRVLDLLGPGSVFGEIGLLLEHPRTATAAAAQEAELWALAREPFQEALQAGAPWAVCLLSQMARALAERLARMDVEFVDLSRQAAAPPGVRRRVAELHRLRERLFTEWHF